MNLDSLTPKQLARYNDSLEVLRLMREGASFYKATKMTGTSPITTKKILGKTLRNSHGRLVARKNDSLFRKVRIYENGKEVFISIKGTKNVKLVAQYHSAVGRRLDKNEQLALMKFSEIKLRDSNGKIHFFETDIKKIQEILQKQEEPEFFSIYKQGVSF
ncbi:MAG: hypothetical protein KGZ37_02310 [Nitrosarchaeum sp.]|nr:hypothetical protein [Nitrosarchaeum sp.]